MIPLKEVISTNVLGTTSGLTSQDLSLLSSGNQLPAFIQEAKVRMLKLNIIYLEKNESGDTFNKNSYNLVHSVSNYDIFHKIDPDSEEDQTSIIWPEGTISYDTDTFTGGLLSTVFNISGSTSINKAENADRLLK